MAELKDPSIKLFGMTILPMPAADQNSDEEDGGFSEDFIVTTASGNPVNPTEEPDKECPWAKKEEKSETSVSEEKTALKKPDKIVPCPRCNSMETKFCYYNNYNVNQPRHFCKNCQRYWTAGGTMRNVPVGAGRRKNKTSQAAHYRHLVMSDALQRAHANPGTGTVLSFASDTPLARGTPARGSGFPGLERRVVVTNGGFDNGDNHSSCSSIITASTSSEKGGEAAAVEYPRPPWPYSWGPPALCGHSGYPVSFYPSTPYWGSVGSWNVPCFSPASSTTNQSSSGSVPNQSVLGKHSRDREILNSASSQKGSPVKEHSHGLDRYDVLVPKTLRIDDPTEAAKSSIWATLGIKNEKLGSSNGGGLHKAFQPKGSEKNDVLEASPVLQANPAAFSRSVRFLEST